MLGQGGASFLTDIRSMIDLAIGTPEVGVVDFCMLHTVLHCLAQQQDALDKPVELVGTTNTPFILPPGKDVQTVAITEYIVETDTATPLKPKAVKPARPPRETTLLVVERVRRDSSPDRSSLSTRTYDRSPGLKAKHETQDTSGGEEGTDEGARQRDHMNRLSLVTFDKFNVLEHTVQELKKHIYNTLPSNSQIIRQVRDSTNDRAITDMWASLNVQSRLEAAELGIAKLSSLVEELIKEYQKMSSGAPAGKGLWHTQTTTTTTTTGGVAMHQAGGPGAPGAAPPGGAPGFGPAPGAPGSAPPAEAPGAVPAAGAPGSWPPAAGVPDSMPPAAGVPGSGPPAAGVPGSMPPAAGVPGSMPPAAGVPGSWPPTAGLPGSGPPAAGAPGSWPPAAGAPGSWPPAAGVPGSWPPGAQDLATLTAEQLQQIQTQTTNQWYSQFGPPYPWDALAADVANDRERIYNTLRTLRSDIDTLNQTFYNTMASLKDNLDLKGGDISLPPPPPSVPIEELLPPPSAGTYPAQEGAAYTRERTAEQTQTLQPPAAEYPPPSAYPSYAPGGGADGRGAGGAGGAAASRRSSGTSASLADRLAMLERRIKECCEDVNKDQGTVKDQLNNFQDQLDHLAREVGSLHDDFGALKLSPNLAKDLEGLVQLYQTVQDMQEQLRQVNEMARQLAGEKDDRQHHIKALLEQIEILKTIKMDREDMAEAMAEKADLRLLARKVSHDQFEMACDDLSRGLEHALGKLNMQESLWQQVLDDVQREIESKLDKMELSPLKEFFENKLRLLQDNLKQMALLRRDVEAAGTKRQLLRDVNCISCDADAVMPLENTATQPTKPLPAHFSMKPYLSYELDAIRKTQASNIPQRNLHDWESIEKQKASRPPMKVRSETDKHICNRYCGGSHTTTTPAQRVARIGHFVKQWGPDVVPLSSGLAAGDDGKLYKVTTTEHANVGPGGSVEPTSMKKQKSPEPTKPPPKVPSILAPKDCHCAD